MLTLVPKSWFSWDFKVLHDGEEVALIDRHSFRESASYSLGDQIYDVRRTSVVQGTFVLERSGEVIAAARKASSFRRTFEITTATDEYRLKAATAFGRTFELWHGSDVVGTVRPTSMLGRRTTADLPATLPPEFQLFIVFLVLVLWKRAATAAAAS